MTVAQQKLYIAPCESIQGEPEVPSSKYYMLRYLLAATLADGESHIHYPAASDDSEALFRGCRALGAELETNQQVVWVRGTGGAEGIKKATQGKAPTVNVGNAGAVTRLLLGPGALSPEITFVTDHPQSLGKRPNRELLDALTQLGARCIGTGTEGCLPITIYGGDLHGGRVEVSGARSSQFLSALLFLAPLIDEDVEIVVTDELKSQPLVRASLEVLRETGISIEHDETLRHFSISAGQRYQAREYTLPGDYPSAAALMALCAVSNDPSSRLRLTRLRPDDEVGMVLKGALRDMQADLRIDGENVTLRGGRRLRAIRLDGDHVIDLIPVLVAIACFAEGESVFYNIENLHYKESDRINDLCAELRKAGCSVLPQRDAIIVRGKPEGVEGGVSVDGHNDHRLLMALATVALRTRRGLTLTGVEHIAKSYPDYFEEMQRLGATIKAVD